MITRVQIRGLRALRYVDVDIDDFQVFVGPNASGKSTFFDALALVRDILQVGVEAAVRGDRRFGVPMRAVDPRDLTWQRQGGNIELSLTARVPDELRNGDAEFVRYELSLATDETLVLNGENLWLLGQQAAQDASPVRQQLQKFPSDVDVPSEAIVFPQNRKAPVGWKKIISKIDQGNDYFRSENSKWNNMFRLGPARSALANLPEDEYRFPIATWFKKRIMEGTQVLAFNAEAMRLPSPAGSPRSFLADGSNLPWVVHQLETEDPDRLHEWVGHVQTALPDIVSIDTHEQEADRSRYVEVTYANGLRAPSWVLSDGTLRMLALTLLAYAQSPGRLLLIEEPENGIHPRAIQCVLQSLASVYEGQVFCATHSPLVLSLIASRQLLCFGKAPSGAVDVVRGDRHPALVDWRAALHLGDLLAMGVLG